MLDCPFHARLNALHDGELQPEEAARLLEHVNGCEVCSAALAELNALSGFFDKLKSSETVTPSDIHALHQAFDRAVPASPLARTDQTYWRAAAFLSGLAASVLVVASAWLWEIPGQPHRQATQLTTAPAWEQVATSLQVDPLPYQGPQQFLNQPSYAQADQSLADWILNNLDQANLNGRNTHETP